MDPSTASPSRPGGMFQVDMFGSSEDKISVKCPHFPLRSTGQDGPSPQRIASCQYLVHLPRDPQFWLLILLLFKCAGVDASITRGVCVCGWGGHLSVFLTEIIEMVIRLAPIYNWRGKPRWLMKTEEIQFNSPHKSGSINLPHHLKKLSEASDGGHSRWPFLQPSLQTPPLIITDPTQARRETLIS